MPTHKKTKGTSPHPLPKPNRQISNAMVRRVASEPQVSIYDRAREFPLHGCWLMADWQERGITPVVVARRQPEDKILFGVYLVDIFCLGLKKVIIHEGYSLERFEQDLPTLCSGSPQAISVELAHEIIYGGIEYAKTIGFDPHPNFKKMKADLVLDPPGAHPRNNQVVFGYEGKPFFVSGPDDNGLKFKAVVDTLRRTCGEGNFDYLVGFEGGPD